MGIGENGHIAFNDPAVADFDDPQAVKVVELDRSLPTAAGQRRLLSRTSTAVPRQAITLTCPALLSGRVLVCVVPGCARRKRSATRCMHRSTARARPRSCAGTRAPRCTSMTHRRACCRARRNFVADPGPGCRPRGRLAADEENGPVGSRLELKQPTEDRMSKDSVRFGIIGAGTIGAFHAEAIRAVDGARLTAVFDSVGRAFPRLRREARNRELRRPRRVSRRRPRSTR